MPSNKKPKKSVRRPTSVGLLPFAGISRTIVLGIIVLAATVGVYFFTGVHAASGEEFLLSYSPGGINYCLDDYQGASGATGNPATADVFKCEGTAAQTWNSVGYKLVAYQGNQCLDVYQGGHTNGTKVDVFPCKPSVGPTSNQAWDYTGSEIIAKGASSVAGHNMCLEVNGFNTTAGRSLDIWQCNQGSNQGWHYQAYSGGGGSSGGGGISSIVNIAAQFAGKEFETPNGCNCGGAMIDGANIDTFEQIPQGTNPGEEWCADFASWVFWKAGYGLASRGAYVKTPGVSSINVWFQDHGHWYPNTAANRAYKLSNGSLNPNRPMPGDWIGFTNSTGTHGGIVASYDGTTLYDYEGNYANGVYKVTYTTSSGFNDKSGGGSIATGWGSF